MHGKLEGKRYILEYGERGYPKALMDIAKPPSHLFLIGDPAALQEGLAIVGARRATPYGLGAASRYARFAAEHGICIISGGALGCDSASHRGALDGGGRTVAFLGGGCDEVYPKRNIGLFQEMIDKGGAVLSEWPWDEHPHPPYFVERNRLIAGLAKATLVVEAGLPSGTFSTADEAIAAGKEVLAVPGSITSAKSHGSNRLIYQGATPIIDDEVFADQLFSIFAVMRSPLIEEEKALPDRIGMTSKERFILEALRAEQLTIDQINSIAVKHFGNTLSDLMVWLARMQNKGIIAKYPNGRYGPVIKTG